MKTNIEQIADRANQLSGAMSHGQACQSACREMGIADSDLKATASIVSTELTNRSISVPRRESTEEEKHPWFAARQARAEGHTWPRRMWPDGWRPGM